MSRQSKTGPETSIICLNMHRLRKIREAEGLTRSDLARRAQVSERTLQRIENEESEPSPVTMNRIVKALNRTPNKLKEYQVNSVFGRKRIDG